MRDPEPDEMAAKTPPHDLGRPAAAHAPVPEPPPLFQRPAKVRILLVEDDPELRRLLASSLHADGYEVVEAGTGTEGVVSVYDMWRSGACGRPIDLIVSDIRMPGWSGLELLDVVRRRRLATPVMLMTAFGAPETHAEAVRLGAAAVLDKPFPLEDFRARVATFVRP